MKPRKRIPRKRVKPRTIHPERSGGHHRVRLYGAARKKRRAEIFERAGGRCEIYVIDRDFNGELIGVDRCPNRATEWSHDRHAANKCDCMSCGVASCQSCHKKRHNAGGKPVPSKRDFVKG